MYFPPTFTGLSGKWPNLFIHLIIIWRSETLCQELIQVAIRYAQMTDLFGYHQTEAFHFFKMSQVFLWRSNGNIDLMK